MKLIPRNFATGNLAPGTVLLKRSAIALTALIVSAAAFAAPPDKGSRWHDGSRHGPPGAEHQLAWLDEALDLSDAQSAELLALLQSAEAERQALHEQIMAEYRPELCALMQETEAGIVAVLTPEQVSAFEDLQANRRNRSDGRWGHGPAGFDCNAADD